MITLHVPDHQVGDFVDWPCFLLNTRSIWDTAWQVIFEGANFCEKSDETPRINFRCFKFRDCNPVYKRRTNDKRMM